MNLLKARLPIPRDLVINFAGMVFLGCAASLFWGEQQMYAIFTLRGFAFVIAGLVLAGVMIGWPLGKMHSAFSYWLLAKNNGEINERNMQILRFTGTALMIVQVLGIYYLTQKAFYAWPVVDLT